MLYVRTIRNDQTTHVVFLFGLHKVLPYSNCQYNFCSCLWSARSTSSIVWHPIVHLILLCLLTLFVTPCPGCKTLSLCPSRYLENSPEKLKLWHCSTFKNIFLCISLALWLCIVVLIRLQKMRVAGHSKIAGCSIAMTTEHLSRSTRAMQTDFPSESFCPICLFPLTVNTNVNLSQIFAVSHLPSS